MFSLSALQHPELDAAALRCLDADMVVFVGDFGEEDVKLVEKVMGVSTFLPVGRSEISSEINQSIRKEDHVVSKSAHVVHGLGGALHTVASCSCISCALNELSLLHLGTHTGLGSPHAQVLHTWES